MNKIWYDIKELLEREASKIVMKNDISPAEIDTLEKVVEIAEGICKMEKIEYEKFNNGNSERRFNMTYDSQSMRNSSNNQSNHYPMDYDPRNMNYPSYKNRSNNYGENSYGGGNSNSSYANNMSNHSLEDRIVHEMEIMMDQTGSEYERQKLQEYISKMRSGK